MEVSNILVISVLSNFEMNVKCDVNKAKTISNIFSNFNRVKINFVPYIPYPYIVEQLVTQIIRDKIITDLINNYTVV